MKEEADTAEEEAEATAAEEEKAVEEDTVVHGDLRLNQLKSAKNTMWKSRKSAEEARELRG
jgi:5'-3' exonuclease